MHVGESPCRRSGLPEKQPAGQPPLPVYPQAGVSPTYLLLGYSNWHCREKAKESSRNIQQCERTDARTAGGVVPESAVDGGGATVEYLGDEDAVVVDDVWVVCAAGDAQTQPGRTLYHHYTPSN